MERLIMTTPTHTTTTDEQVAEDFEYIYQQLRLHIGPELSREVATLNCIHAHIALINEQNLQLAAEVERCREVLQTVSHALHWCNWHDHSEFSDRDSMEAKTSDAVDSILSTPNPGAELLEELKADKERLDWLLALTANPITCSFASRFAIDSAKRKESDNE